MTFTAPKHRTAALAFIVALAMLGLATGSRALADPMKCSGEEKSCIAACQKAARTAVSVCVTNCGVRSSACKKTGCWDNGVQRYCGLSKQ